MGSPGKGVVKENGFAAIHPITGKEILFDASGNACDCCGSVPCKPGFDIGFAAQFPAPDWMTWFRLNGAPGGLFRPPQFSFDVVDSTGGAFSVSRSASQPSGIWGFQNGLQAKLPPPSGSNYTFTFTRDLALVQEVAVTADEFSITPLDPFCWATASIDLAYLSPLLLVGRHYYGGTDKYYAAAPYFGGSHFLSLHDLILQPGWVAAGERPYLGGSSRIVYRREWTNLIPTASGYWVDVVHTLTLNGIVWRGPEVQLHQAVTFPVAVSSCPNFNPVVRLMGTNSPYPLTLNGNVGSVDRAYFLSMSESSVIYNGIAPRS